MRSNRIGADHVPTGMKRMLGTLLVMSALVLGLASAAGASTVAVSIMNHGFTPSTVMVGQGGAVTWTQHEQFTQHTSTSDNGFWGSAALNPGQSFTAKFWSAGSFHYHCRIHPDMRGVVQVPVIATGSASMGWRLRWSSLASVPKNRAFDVQIKRPGATAFVSWHGNFTNRTAPFDPAKTGTYAFRARLKNLSNGQNSGWSPAESLKIS